MWHSMLNGNKSSHLLDIHGIEDGNFKVQDRTKHARWKIRDEEYKIENPIQEEVSNIMYNKLEGTSHTIRANVVKSLRVRGGEVRRRYLRSYMYSIYQSSTGVPAPINHVPKNPMASKPRLVMIQGGLLEVSLVS